ncbi:MAG: DUF2892 domain-containing protein [Chlorobiales bacterium]|nr:DUF2892 domain-containing protein [Chlorobiales bacterium]
MTRNVGQTDRILRILAGVGIIGAGIYSGSWLGVFGLIPLLTGSLGWCPLYQPFGFSTFMDKPHEKPRVKPSGR